MQIKSSIMRKENLFAYLIKHIKQLGEGQL